MGVVVATRAMEIAMDRAGKQGCATVLVKHANHYGAGLYYASMATARNQIAYLYANANPSMPPWGGSAKLFGTNPYTLALRLVNTRRTYWIWRPRRLPINKVLHAALAGKPIPESWGYDENGKPCTDPQRVLNGGSLQPFGGSRVMVLRVWSTLWQVYFRVPPLDMMCAWRRTGQMSLWILVT